MELLLTLLALALFEIAQGGVSGLGVIVGNLYEILKRRLVSEWPPVSGGSAKPESTDRPSGKKTGVNNSEYPVRIDTNSTDSSTVKIEINHHHYQARNPEAPTALSDGGPPQQSDDDDAEVLHEK